MLEGLSNGSVQRNQMQQGCHVRERGDLGTDASCNQDCICGVVFPHERKGRLLSFLVDIFDFKVLKQKWKFDGHFNLFFPCSGLNLQFGSSF